MGWVGSLCSVDNAGQKDDSHAGPDRAGWGQISKYYSEWQAILNLWIVYV